MSNRPEGSREYVAFVKETTYGVTPSTPSLTRLPIKKTGLKQAISSAIDDTIRGHGMPVWGKLGNKSVAGSIEGNMVWGEVETLFENVLATEADVNGVIKASATDTNTSFTIENGYQGSNYFSVYTGCVVDKIKVAASVGGTPATFTADLIGKEEEVNAASLDVDGIADPSVRPPLTHQGGTFTVDGVASSVITGIEFTIDRGIKSEFTTWGDDTVTRLTSSKKSVSGSLSFILIDNAIRNKLVNGVTADLTFTLFDGSKYMEFKLPKTFIQSHEKQSCDGSVNVKASFTALYDAASGSSISVRSY